MQAFNILDPNLNVFESRFLEASAGTGKTFAIQHLFVRLLSEGKTPYDLPEILAVTFTREAAHEMKARIRKNIVDSHAENPQIMETALAVFDEIQVFTIHGFCHKMLSEFAFEAGITMQMSDPDQADHIEQMREVVIDFFRVGSTKFAPEVTALLRRNRYDYQRLINQVLIEMQKEHEPISYEFPSLPSFSYSEIWEQLSSLSSKYKRMKFENAKEQIEKLSLFLESTDPQHLIGEKTWFFEKLREESGFFHTLQTKLLPELQIFNDPKQMLFRIAKECRRLWLSKSKRHDHFTFDDLLSKMRKAIEIPEFKEKVQQKYKAIIVDEFQDTDPIQWEIFENLFLTSHIIYLVGDPKQSIYGFRNADIYTYMRAADQIGQGSKCYLDTNYRSSPALIVSLNELFTKRSNWIDLPARPNTLCYHPVKAGREGANLDEQPIVFFGCSKDPGREKSFPTKKMEEESLFPYIASEIIRLHEKVSFASFAILIKDRFQAERIHRYLSKLHIPSHIKKAKHLAETRGFLAMETLLQAIEQPNSTAVQVALCGPLMDRGESPFFALHEMVLEKGVEATLSYFMHHHFKGHGDLTLLEECKQTCELLLQSRALDLHELLHLMREWKEMSFDVEPALEFRPGENQDQVAIMTTFASKGLEFDVVFALGMASRHGGEEYSADREAEKMRQLYVAFTRAREKLYIPIVIDESAKPLPAGVASPIELFFAGDYPSFEQNAYCPSPLKKENTDAQLVSPPALDLTFPIETLTSFSAMTSSHTRSLVSEIFKQQDFSKKTSHTLPLGAESGTVIHEIFEKVFSRSRQSIEQTICEVLTGTHLEGWEETIAEMVNGVLQIEILPNFSLSQLPSGSYYQEMEFLFPQGNRWVKGFADLVFQVKDTFYLVDWKTNWLGPSDDDYTWESMKKVMEENEYYLQAELYSEALMRYVKRLYKNPQYGGAYYIFTRGKKAVGVGTG